jgi:hypothetical protein
VEWEQEQVLQVVQVQVLQALLEEMLYILLNKKKKQLIE